MVASGNSPLPAGVDARPQLDQRETQVNGIARTFKIINEDLAAAALTNLLAGDLVSDKPLHHRR